MRGMTLECDTAVRQAQIEEEAPLETGV